MKGYGAGYREDRKMCVGMLWLGFANLIRIPAVDLPEICCPIEPNGGRAIHALFVSLPLVPLSYFAVNGLIK